MNPNSKSIDDIINASSISEFLSEVKSDNTNVDASKGGIQDPNIEDRQTSDQNIDYVEGPSLPDLPHSVSCRLIGSGLGDGRG